MILQSQIPYNPLQQRPLPGIQPLEMDDWLLVDDAYGAQIKERDRLLRTNRQSVLATSPESKPAEQELLQMVLGNFPAGFETCGHSITCPDGRNVHLNLDDPLATIAALVQEDMCILQKQGDAHIMTAALLCFPASWRLVEKIGKPLTGIHDPVPEYDEQVARRVQRLFDGIQVDRPLWRFNGLWYQDPALFQPRSVVAPREATETGCTPYFRSERQCLVRLPETRAVVFSIHTFVVARETVLNDQA